MIYALEYHEGRNRWAIVDTFFTAEEGDVALDLWVRANHPSATMYKARVRDTGRRFTVDVAGKMGFRKVLATGWDAYHQKNELLHVFDTLDKARVKALEICDERVKRAASDLKHVRTMQRRATTWEPKQ